MSSPHYVHGYAPSVVSAHARRMAATSCAYLLPHLASGMSVLDVGSGPGTITCDLATIVQDMGRVVGVDLSPDVVAAATAEAARRGLTNVTFQEGDVFSLPPEDSGFDVVHAHQVLQHVADPVGALRAMAARARPGGIVAVRDSDYPAMAWWPESEGLSRWMDLYLHIARAAGGHPDAGRRMRRWALDAGLTDVTLSTSTWTYATPETTAWWGDSWAERVVGSDFADQCESEGLASAEELQAIADAWRTWAGAPDAWFTVLHGELLAHPTPQS